MNLTNSEIARQVKLRLKERDLTLDSCCDAFNLKYSDEMNANNMRPLNKDFVSRITREDFKVCSPRISKLCEFLEIRDADSAAEPLMALSREIGEFKKYSNSNKEFKSRFPAVGRFLSGLNIEQMFDDS